jgi:hypothetical protein
MSDSVEEKIRLRAYAKFLSRSNGNGGNGHGSDMSDWLEAEKEVFAEDAQRGAKPKRRRKAAVGAH